MKSVKVSTFVFFGLAFVCFLSLVPGIQADTMVTVPNGDFSSPTVPSDPGWQDGLIPDHWSYTGTASEGLEIVGSGQAVYMNQTESGQVGTLSQNDIGASVHAIGDKYTLTFDLASNNTGDGSCMAELLVGGSEVTSSTVTWSGGTSMAPYSLNWIANASGNLGIEFVATDFSGKTQALLGNVGLSYTIPEPSVVALLATTLVSLLAYAWRKRR